MTALFIDNLIYILFVFVIASIPICIISVIVCVILDIEIKKHESNNYLGRGKEKNNGDVWLLLYFVRGNSDSV